MNGYMEFGKYLLNHLGLVDQPEELDWDFITRSFTKRERKDWKPGLVWINWVIATYFGMDAYEIRSVKSRKRDYVYPKHISMYLSNALFGHTQDDITEFYTLVVKNRSSVSNAIRNVTSLMKTDKYFKLDVEEIINKLLNNEEDKGSSSIGSIISVPESDNEKRNDMSINRNRKIESTN